MALLVCAACRPSAPKKPAAVPQLQATVVTIATTIEPGPRALRHTLVISGDRARISSDTDRWRLFDIKAHTVTFVDEIARTIREEPLEAIVRKRKSAFAAPLRDGIPRAQITRGTNTRTLLGTVTSPSTIRSGTYVRELWVGRHPAIPDGLFAMIAASEPIPPELAPMMRDADAALVALSGFPLADHAELPYLDGKFVVDRSVISIEKRSVPRATLDLPSGYRKEGATQQRPAAKGR